MAEHGVAALSHVPSGERVRTGSADPSGAWDQDHPPSTATTTQESGLRENRTSRLSERTEEGRKPDLLRLYIPKVGERSPLEPVETVRDRLIGALSRVCSSVSPKSFRADPALELRAGVGLRRSEHTAARRRRRLKRPEQLRVAGTRDPG